MAVSLISASWAQKRWFLLLDMMYDEFMKNFFLADSSELLAFRLILASWAQKRLIPTFLDMMYVEFMKNFHLAWLEQANGC